MSDREKLVQQVLPYIPVTEHKEILEDLAYTEALFVADGRKKIAEKHWEELKLDLNYWTQQDQYKRKK